MLIIGDKPGFKEATSPEFKGHAGICSSEEILATLSIPYIMITFKNGFIYVCLLSAIKS